MQATRKGGKYCSARGALRVRRHNFLVEVFGGKCNNRSLMIYITIASGILTVILFFLVALASRKIDDESVAPFSSFFDIIVNCCVSIVRGLFRGEFKNKFELSILIAFVVSFAVFIWSILSLFN